MEEDANNYLVANRKDRGGHNRISGQNGWPWRIPLQDMRQWIKDLREFGEGNGTCGAVREKVKLKAAGTKPCRLFLCFLLAIYAKFGCTIIII